jgi:hypothetical protein
VIISHRHRFIFVKTRKTAGTSVERFLSTFLGPDDVIVGADHRNETGRWNPLPELAHKHDSLTVRSTMGQWRNRRRYYPHIPAWRIRARLGRSTWDDYYKFCFERDPWDKVESSYWWRTRDMDPRPDFADWLDGAINQSAWLQYTIDDQVAVDFIGQFENLEADLRVALERIGLDVPIDLPREKSGYRRAEGVTFTPALDDSIAHEFRHEMALLGYEKRASATD